MLYLFQPVRTRLMELKWWKSVVHLSNFRGGDGRGNAQVNSMHAKSLRCVWLFAIPQTVAHQAPLSMGFSRQEDWSGLPFPPPGDLPDPGIKPVSPALQVDPLPLNHLGSQMLCLKVKWTLVTQLHRTLCDPMDCSLPGSSVCGLLQARVLEWVAMPFSRVSSWSRVWTQAFCIAGGFFTIWATREPDVMFGDI